MIKDKAVATLGIQPGFLEIYPQGRAELMHG